MPELPEVEVTRRGLAPNLEGHTLNGAVVRDSRLRWPVPPNLSAKLAGLIVTQVGRRGKYLLIECQRTAQQSSTVAQPSGKRLAIAGNGAGGASWNQTSSGPTSSHPSSGTMRSSLAGWLIVHLGMSGSLRFVSPGTPAQKHDHVDLVMQPHLLRLHDPRRFGAVLWHPASAGPVESHPLLAHLGAEPLDAALDPAILFHGSRGRQTAVKQLLLAGSVVVGVGNIYASEALFRARIHPATAAGRIGRARYTRLMQEIVKVLGEAIKKGRSILRDFTRSDGEPGYFQLDYFVYGREGEPCRICRAPIRAMRQGQRSTFYCARCQT